MRKKTLSHHLPEGTILNSRYRIDHVIGEGGFGITYKGFDTVLKLEVAIKEYYPNGVAMRYSKSSLNVTLTNENNPKYFAKWKDKFLNEARTLASLSSIGNIVNVRDYFEENSTAYIVMEYLSGKTLKDIVRTDGPIEPQEMKELLISLLKPLQHVHDKEMIHRDISPDNIMLMPDGTLKLFDFGAARDYSAQRHSSYILVKHGFAPLEQYQSSGKQGRWTDIYAICATFYYCVTGKVPDDCMQRVSKDELKRPSELGIDIPKNVENAIMKGLSIKAEDRFQSADELAQALTEESKPANSASGSKDIKTEVMKKQYVDKTKTTPMTNDLQSLKQSGMIFSNKQIIQCAFQLCKATEYLHTKSGIIHRDIKPSNIRLDNDGKFFLEINNALLYEGVMGDTPGYAPPEQLGISLVDIKRYRKGKYKGHELTEKQDAVKRFADERSDIFSIGASLYYMATGVEPSASYCSKPVRELSPEIADGLARVIVKAMQPVPEQRYQTVSEMLKDLNNIARFDKRYRSLKIQRIAVTVEAAILLFSGAAFAKIGHDRLGEEREEKYISYLAQAKDNMASGDHEKALEASERASELFPTRLEPFYNKLYIMHEKKEHDDCIVYPDEVINSAVLSDENNDSILKSEFYALAADSAFEEKCYPEAAKWYEQAIYHYSGNTDCYHDMIISQVKTGDLEGARAALASAEKTGVPVGLLAFLDGKISCAEGNIEKALESFGNAVRETEDQAMRFEALTDCYNMTKANNVTAQQLKQTIDMLEQSNGKIPAEHNTVFTEMLAHQYGRYALQSEDSSYYEKARAYYETLDNSTLSYESRKNYVSVCEKLKQYDKCLQLLGAMVKENDSDYWIYMQQSYIRYYIEMEKDTPAFISAYGYYTKAKELYEKQAQSTGSSDPDMDKLTDTMEYLQQNGML